MESQVQVLDIAVIVLYLAGVIGLGLYVARGQKETADYFLAGRKMGFWAVGISIIASLFSAISYLACPTETYLRNWKYSLSLWTIPLASVFVVIVFIPFYYHLKLFTAYEYLQKRFNMIVRTAASLLFILARFGWMALVIWAPSLALAEIFHLRPEYCVLIIGVVATAYTVIGGIRAVIFTDVVQFFVLFVGIVTVPIVVIKAFAAQGTGIFEMWHLAASAGKMATFDWTPSLETAQATVWAALIAATVMNIGQYGSDQVAVQRYLTTKSLKDATKSLWLNAIVVVPMGIIFYSAGTFLWLFYNHMKTPPVLEHPDRILPYFFVTELPTGFSGLLIAALFAATMSSIDSGINSVSTAFITDFYQGLFKRRRDPKSLLLLSKIITLAAGVLVTAFALGAKYFGATIIEQTNTIAALFNGPLIGIFLLGVLTKRANWQGVLTGAAFGVLVCFLYTFALKNGWWGLPVVKLYFLWFTFMGTLPTVIIGYLASYLWPAPTAETIKGLVFRWKLRYEVLEAGAEEAEGQEAAQDEAASTVEEQEQTEPEAQDDASQEESQGGNEQ